jgi:predicted N-acetyltransferase YhbS
MSCDMLVKLYNVEEDASLTQSLCEKKVSLKKVMPPDLSRVTDFVREHFGDNWANEAHVAVIRNRCWIAVRDKKILGFACYDATMPDFFGPIGVLESERKIGLGKALLLRGLLSMKEMGYAYAIIGWTGPMAFYSKCVGAVEIPDSIPASYHNMIGV